jgi:hypothetical protein
VSGSTGPVLVIGAVTLANNSIFHDRPVDIRIPIATAIAAGGLALAERLSRPLAVGIAWTALLTVLFVRTDARIPAPVETVNEWWQKGGKL